MNNAISAAIFLSSSVAPAVGAAALGGLTGILAMLLYARLSPQSRVAQLGDQAGEARLALNRFDGEDLHELWSLTRRAVGLSLQQMRLILGPATLAGLAVCGSAWVANGVFHYSRMRFDPVWTPSWISVGWVVFWGPLTITAAGLKWARKIK